MTRANFRGSASCDQNAVFFHPLNRVLQQLDPLRIARCQRVARCGVGFPELSGQPVVGGRAGVADAPQVAHVQIDPALEVVEGVKLRKLGLAVKFQHHIDLARDDRADQRPLVGEIVGELRAANRRGLAQSVHVQRRQTLAENQLGGDLHDPVAGGATLGGQAPVVLQIGINHNVRLTRVHRRYGMFNPYGCAVCR